MSGFRWWRLPLYIVVAPFVAVAWVLRELLDAMLDLMDWMP